MDFPIMMGLGKCLFGGYKQGDLTVKLKRGVFNTDEGPAYCMFFC